MKKAKSKLKMKPFLGWWIFAIVCRTMASFTHSHWFHPDEWRQTLEPANLIAHGFGYHCQEFGLHLRNLTWPTLLAGVLKLTHFLSPQSIDLRIFAVNFFCGSLDLLILWGWVQLLNRDEITGKFSKTAKSWGLALLLLPWFTVYESVNPKGEHLSEIALWAALGCIAKRFWFLAGFACVGISAFRYPSVLLSVGIFVGLFLQMFKSKDYRALPKLAAGILTGLGVFGVADWMIYGRPWESSWMYLQYNVLTGSSTLVFGHQGISAYLDLFTWNWITYKLLIPLSLFLIVSSFYGLWNGLQRSQPWAYCLVIYFLGHCLVPHKEGRFMVPIEVLTRWAAFVGAVLILREVLTNPKRIAWAKSLAAVFLITNSVIFLHALRADLWRDRGTYRELGSHLKKTPRVCGVLTTQEISSMLMPFENGSQFPIPALGTFRRDAEHFSYDDTKSSRLTWVEHLPQCGPGDELLLHAQKAEPSWTQNEGCTLLSSGVLRLLPESTWDWALKRNLVKGPWYRCPPGILNHFESQAAIHIYSRSFGKLASLPRLGITPQELEDLGLKTVPPPADASLPSLSHPSRPF